MALDKKSPLYNLHFVPERPQGKKSPWYRCGAIWATDNDEVVNVVVELLNPATGETVRLSFMGTVPRQDQSGNGDNE